MKSLSAYETVLQPLPESVLPEPTDNTPLFEGDERTWYLAFVERWNDFQGLTTQFYQSQIFRSAFDEIKGYPISPPRNSDDTTKDRSDSDIFADSFQREVLEVVEGICNKLLKTMTMQEADVPESVFLRKAADEDLGNEDVRWAPKYVVRAKPIDGDDETRLIGHVEYLRGRPGALLWAIQEQLKNSWGSLRCVLGEPPYYIY